VLSSTRVFHSSPFAYGSCKPSIYGCDHEWFEERAARCTLLVDVDDATSRLMQLHFCDSESTFSYFEATGRYLDSHGKPVTFCSDKYSVFRVDQPEPWR